MAKITDFLNKTTTGMVLDDKDTVEKYAVDGGPLKIVPQVVAFPENTKDIRKIVRFVSQLNLKGYQISLTPRGSGLSANGSALSKDIVVSMAKMNQIVEFDEKTRLVHVQAGATIGDINAVLAPSGLCIPINAEPEETIGGLISSCKTDTYAMKYGGIMHYVEKVEVVLSNGELFETEKISLRNYDKKLTALRNSEKAPVLTTAIYEKLPVILEKFDATIKALKSEPSLAGYPGISYVQADKTLDTLPLFLAAEGTLGLITEVILRCEPIEDKPEVVVSHFPNLKSALDFLDEVIKLNPLEANIYDSRIFKSELAEDTTFGPLFQQQPANDMNSDSPAPSFLTLISFNDAGRAVKSVQEALTFLPQDIPTVEISAKENIKVEKFKNSLKLYLLGSGKKKRPGFFSHFFLPKNALEEFVSETNLELFGSYYNNDYDVRPRLALEKAADREISTELLQEIHASIKALGGNLTGGSPEGRLKQLFMTGATPESNLILFREIRKLFDPDRIFSPDLKKFQ